jgi:uncharacterized damage-inducible protein DinB
MSADDTATSFAAWVVPQVAAYREHRAEAARLARSLSADQLARPAADAGWTVRDELVHIASTDPDFVGMLRSLVAGGTPDTSAFADVDARNARNLAAWAERSMAYVADALERNGREIEALLARLTDEDERRQPDGIPFPLGQIVMGSGMHAAYHVANARMAAEAR